MNRRVCRAKHKTEKCFFSISSVSFSVYKIAFRLECLSDRVHVWAAETCQAIAEEQRSEEPDGLSIGHGGDDLDHFAVFFLDGPLDGLFHLQLRLHGRA